MKSIIVSREVENLPFPCDNDIFDKISYGGKKRKQIVQPASLLEARAILGRDFINPNDVSKFLNYPHNQIGHLVNEMLSSKLLLYLKKNNCILIPGPPTGTTVNNVLHWFPDLIKNKYPKLLEGNNQYHLSSNKTGNLTHIHPGWIIVSKKVLKHSANKNWWEQAGLVRGNKYVLDLGKLIWSLYLYWLVNGVKLFNHQSIRTATMDRYGERVIVSGQNSSVWFPDNGRDSKLVVVSGISY